MKVWITILLLILSPVIATAQRNSRITAFTLKSNSATELQNNAIDFRGFQSIFSFSPDSTSQASSLTAADLRTPVFDSFEMRTYPGGIKANLTPGWRPAAASDSVETDSIDNLYQASKQYFAQRLFADSLINAMREAYMFNYPALVRYNVRVLPLPPKRYRSVLDPSTLRIVMEEISLGPDNRPGKATVIMRRANWLHKFDGSLQFSQAYISPNWYQGGSNALNLIGGVNYNVQLNRTFYPKLLAEADINYKLSLTSTPDDSLRTYTLTEDLFQFTGRAGFKAMNHWFYTLTANFKTQFFNNYPVNSKKLAAGFLSPGELNLGLGMTYEYTSADKRFSVNAAFSPVSWNLKTCVDDRIDPESVGIDAGRKTKSEFGSSSEIKLAWKITRDIEYTSRLFAFTQYKESQLDWENNINFAINKFLSTRLYTHLRYDSTTPPLTDSKWHLWQFKEILSLGFNYKFSTL